MLQRRKYIDLDPAKADLSDIQSRLIVGGGQIVLLSQGATSEVPRAIVLADIPSRADAVYATDVKTALER